MVRNRSHYSDFTAIQSGYCSHPLLNEDPVIGPHVIRKKSCEYEDFHGDGAGSASLAGDKKLPLPEPKH
jgi:hypothetical protein